VVVHDRVAIVPGAIFPRHLVIGDALLRQYSADPDILAILIGRAALLDHILVKAGTLIDAQDAGDATDHTANDTAHDGADRAGRPFSFSRASLNSTGDALGRRCGGDCNCGGNGSDSDETADHGNS
jgi:hypothetical protein